MTTRGWFGVIVREDGSWSRWRGCWWRRASSAATTAGAQVRGRAGCNTKSPSRAITRSLTLTRCIPMLFFVDLATADRSFAAGELKCPHDGCGGRLGSWGSARERTVRVSPGVGQRYTPRRGRCRACKHTQVLASTRTFPRHPDAAATAGAALQAAATGLGADASPSRSGCPPRR